jgi:hypothetical protein
LVISDVINHHRATRNEHALPDLNMLTHGRADSDQGLAADTNGAAEGSAGCDVAALTQFTIVIDPRTSVYDSERTNGATRLHYSAGHDLSAFPESALSPDDSAGMNKSGKTIATRFITGSQRAACDEAGDWVSRWHPNSLGKLDALW